MSVFQAPVWESQTLEYVLKVQDDFSEEAFVEINTQGSTQFKNDDEVLNITDDLIAALISEGGEKKWFAKLPTQEQLMKKVRHTFAALATADQGHARPVVLRMNPKSVTIVWRPEKKATPSPPPLAFEDSEPEESEGETENEGPEPEIADSNLPAVALREEAEMSREQYLLTRLRAAKARLEAEQIRMQYFEATGQMPPDSDSEDSEGDF